jgi:probable phosphoglycerate mutase
VAVDITLIRHPETTSNAAGTWQGQADSPLSPQGREQLDRLAARLAGGRPTLMLSSELGRAVTSAAALGEAVPDETWNEMDLGSWDGLTPAEIRERFPEESAALFSGADIRVGGGERFSEFAARTRAALTDLVGRLDDGDRAVVVTHGGVIHSLTGWVLGIDSRAVLAMVANTSLTTLRSAGEYRRRVMVYNDVSHLEAPVADSGAPQVLLFRHGQTDANVSGRWQGRGPGALTDLGRAQAAGLAETAPEFGVLYSSPLDRALHTASVLGDRRGVAVRPVDDLVEMDFGAWENLTAEQAEAEDPVTYARIYGEGEEDLPRGRTGESFANAGSRMADAVARLVAGNGAETVAMVVHGGATRAYVARLLGLSFAERERLALLRNTAFARIGFPPAGPALVQYNIAPHAEG